MALFTAVCWLFVSLRVLLYRRNHDTYKFLYSAMAWLVISLSFARAIVILFGGLMYGVLEAMLAAAVLAMFIRSRGNVSCIVRPGTRCAIRS